MQTAPSTQPRSAPFYLTLPHLRSESKWHSRRRPAEKSAKAHPMSKKVLFSTSISDHVHCRTAGMTSDKWRSDHLVGGPRQLFIFKLESIISNLLSSLTEPLKLHIRMSVGIYQRDCRLTYAPFSVETRPPFSPTCIFQPTPYFLRS